MATLATYTSLPGCLSLQSLTKTTASPLRIHKKSVNSGPYRVSAMTQLRNSMLAAPSRAQTAQNTPELGEGESERLALDAEAMKAMAEVAENESKVESSAPGAWKWAIRKRVWDLLEARNLAQDPRPVHHRIPNFVGAAAAAAKLASLPAFVAAQCVKVNPDTPQKQVRFLTLNGGKKLLTPQPRLRTGFFSIMEASTVPNIQEACTSAGVAKHGKTVGLDDELKVDLLVIGSVAVDPATGARLGKGEGFAELEYGILRWMGAIDDSTLVVTTVNDKQLVDDIPVDKLLIHDVPVDIICTPTKIIHTNTAIPKPQGIYWEKLSPQKLQQIRVLRDLKKRLELETGHTLPSGPEEALPALAARKRPQKSTSKTRVNASTSQQTIFMWNISLSTTWRDLQEHLEQLGASVSKVNLFRKSEGSLQMARILLKEGTDVSLLVEAVDKTSLHGAVVRAKVDELKSTSKAANAQEPVTT